MRRLSRSSRMVPLLNHSAAKMGTIGTLQSCFQNICELPLHVKRRGMWREIKKR